MLNSDLWVSVICSSTYFESVLSDKVPTMTSDTTPHGECISTGNSPWTSSYQAFDGDDDSEYASSNYGVNVESYIGYKFINPICCKKMAFVPAWAETYDITFENFVFEASNYGATWNNIHSFQNTKTNTLVTIDFDNNSYYKYYRLKRTSTNANASNPRLVVRTLQFYGRFQK